MKNTLIKASLGMLALGLVASGAHAGWNRDSYPPQRAYLQSQAYGQHINASQQQLIRRIQHGKQSGLLARAEFRELMREQHKIQAMEQRFRADGLIDAREFQRLERALDRASHSIRAVKHDRRARHAYGAGYRLN